MGTFSQAMETLSTGGESTAGVCDPAGDSTKTVRFPVGDQKPGDGGKPKPKPNRGVVDCPNKGRDVPESINLEILDNLSLKREEQYVDGADLLQSVKDKDGNTILEIGGDSRGTGTYFKDKRRRQKVDQLPEELYRSTEDEKGNKRPGWRMIPMGQD